MLSGLLATVGTVQPHRLALHVHLPLLLKTLLLLSSLQGGLLTEAQLSLQPRLLRPAGDGHTGAESVRGTGEESSQGSLFTPFL